MYAFRGLAGRFAPIGVHLALLLVMAGGTLSATGSYKGSVTVPQGLNFVIGDVLGPSGFLSTPSESFNTQVHVNRFYMDYYDSGEVGIHGCNMTSQHCSFLNISFKCFILLCHRFLSFIAICLCLTLMGRR